MVPSPFEWGNQISRGKTSGELSDKSRETRRVLLWVRIVFVFFLPIDADEFMWQHFHFRNSNLNTSVSLGYSALVKNLRLSLRPRL